ncbi:hypothetical protein RJ640_006473 [Escallonia rubra]|uniref:SHSP domain-containing protein n=1 Tax=Escallonia rubra TaxID=112253 RepID=A0AA88UI95_9ASTE|nr:hypothetical protein RJ640_006473 [Escallonia rubra]
MAMTPRVRGVSPVPPRPRLRRVYEDFRPTSERQQQEEFDLLSVFLPGFTKENIKVTTEGRTTVRVRGERLVAGNRWNRFQEAFQAPENCDMSRVLRKFDSGILTVTMPRKTTATQVAPEAEAKTEPPSTPYVGADARAEQKSQKAKEDIPPQATSSVLDTGKPADTDISSPQRTAREPKRPTGEGETPPKITPIVHVDRQTDGRKSFEGTTTDSQKIPSKPESQKGKEETPIAATSGTDERKQKDEKEPSESETKEKATKKTAGRESMRQEKGRDSEAKAKETTKVTAFGGYEGESSKKTVNGIPYEPNEERKLMVNMGAAVLVIVAVGAYVAYTFGSSGKAKQ